MLGKKKKLPFFESTSESWESSHLKGVFGGANRENTNALYFIEKADDLKPQCAIFGLIYNFLSW